jgi:hypothetical protein
MFASLAACIDAPIAAESKRPGDDDVDPAVDEVLDIRGLTASVVVRHVHNPFCVDPIGVAQLLSLGTHIVFPGLIKGAFARVPTQSNRDVLGDGRRPKG